MRSRIRVRQPAFTARHGRQRHATKLVWHTDRVAAALGFVVGVLAMLLAALIVQIAWGS